MSAPSIDKLWEGWNPPPELNRAKPRPVTLTGGGVALTVFSIVMALGGIGVGIGLRIDGQHREAELRLMDEQGRDAQAVVTRLWQTGGKSSQNMAAYRFTADGREFRNEASLALSHWESLRVDSPVAIRYLPSDPARNFPVSDPPMPAPLWAAILIVAEFVSLAALFQYLTRRERRLLEEGLPAPAVVTRNRKAPRRGNSISYEFLVPGVGRCKGRCNRQHVSEGTVICILYNAENPRRNVPYPLRLVKLAER